MALFSFIAIIGFIVVPLRSLEAVVEVREVRLGETVSLRCSISFHHGITWLKLDSHHTVTEVMVTNLNTGGELSIIWKANALRFHGELSDRSISLRIDAVSHGDLALYYCVGRAGKRLQFGNGTRIQVFSAVDPPDPTTAVGNQHSADCQQAPPKGSSGPSLLYQVFAAVLGCGQLGMILAVVSVHLKTRKRNGD